MVAKGWLRPKDMPCDVDIISKKTSDKVRGLSFLAAVLVVPLTAQVFRKRGSMSLNRLERPTRFSLRVNYCSAKPYLCVQSLGFS